MEAQEPLPARESSYKARVTSKSAGVAGFAYRLRLKRKLRLDALYELLDLMVFAAGCRCWFDWFFWGCHAHSLSHNADRSKTRTVPSGGIVRLVLRTVFTKSSLRLICSFCRKRVIQAGGGARKTERGIAGMPVAF